MSDKLQQAKSWLGEKWVLHPRSTYSATWREFPGSVLLMEVLRRGLDKWRLGAKMNYSWYQSPWEETESERKYRALESRIDQIQNELMKTLRADTLDQQLFHIERALVDIEDVRDMLNGN